MSRLFHLFALAATMLPPAAIPQDVPPRSAQAANAPAASAPLQDQGMTALALKIYAQIRTGKVDPALFTSSMYAALRPEVLAENKPLTDQLGDLQSLKLESVAKLPAGTSYQFLATFPKAQFHIGLLLTSEGRIGGYTLKP